MVLDSGMNYRCFFFSLKRIVLESAGLSQCGSPTRGAAVQGQRVILY